MCTIKTRHFFIVQLFDVKGVNNRTRSLVIFYGGVFIAKKWVKEKESQGYRRL